MRTLIKKGIIVQVLSIYLTVYLCMIPIISYATEMDAGAVAIMVFQNLTGDQRQKTLENVIPEAISTRLASNGVVEVVERSRLEALLEERELDDTGLVDEKTAAEFGKMVGAKTVIIGSYSKSGSDIVINARAVDVESAKVITASSKQDKSSNVTDAAREVADDLQYKLTGIKVVEKKSIFKKWWFWGLVAAAAGGAAAGMSGGGKEEESEPLPGFPSPPE